MSESRESLPRPEGPVVDGLGRTVRRPEAAPAAEREGDTQQRERWEALQRGKEERQRQEMLKVCLLC